MNKGERFFATMRRWVAVNKCLATLSEREQSMIANFFERVDMATIAKSQRLTKERCSAKILRLCAILADMLCDDAGPPPPL